jgi:hypothetical protein
MSNSRTIQSTTPIVEVPTTSAIDISNPAIIKLIEQGGTIASLILVCFFVYLLTRLIEAAKKN